MQSGDVVSTLPSNAKHITGFSWIMFWGCELTLISFKYSSLKDFYCFKEFINYEANENLPKQQN